MPLWLLKLALVLTFRPPEPLMVPAMTVLPVPATVSA